MHIAAQHGVTGDSFKLIGIAPADPYADQIIQMVGNVAHITYSRKDEKADVFATRCTYNIWETAIEIKTPFGELKIITTLIGQNNVHNVLAAVAAGLAMSIPIKVKE